MTLDRDISQVIESIKEELHYSGLMLPNADSKYPAVQLIYPSTNEQKINNAPVENYSFQLRIFMPRQRDWDENELSDDQYEILNRFQDYIRSIVDILSDKNHTFGYTRPNANGGQIIYAPFHTENTEHKYFGINATVNLTKSVKKDCCLEYDNSGYVKSSWAK